MSNIKTDMPLVSIIVMTYNSSEFIIECLDSIRLQTYQNIELIISDDCSLDETVSICNDWLFNNKEKFVNVELIEVSENTGVTKNINRGCKIAKGKWIKLLAGDDILLPKCIELNIQNCYDKKIIFSQLEMFSENGSLGLAISETKKSYFDLSAEAQFQKLFVGNFVCAPSGFINTEYLRSVNYFDEYYPMMEDYPFWLKSTYNGVKLNYFDDTTVRYRVHEKSLSNRVNSIYNERMYKMNKKLFNEFIKHNNVKICLIINRFFVLLVQKRTINNGNNIESHKKYRKLQYLNPCKYLEKIIYFINLVVKKLLRTTSQGCF